MHRPSSPIFKRGSLVVGVLLLVLVAVGPAFAVLMTFQRALWRERDVQARMIASQRAELVDTSLASIVEGARQMMVVLSMSADVQRLDGSCEAILQDLRRGMPAYVVLAVLRQDGTPVCSDAPEGSTPDALAIMAQPLAPAAGFVTGTYAGVSTQAPPVLTFALPFLAKNGTDKGLLLAGLDLSTLAKLLGDLHQPGDGRVIVADRNGLILARVPDDAGSIGSMVPVQARGLLLEATAGAIIVRGPEGPQRVIGYVPPGAGTAGLFVGAGFDVADLVSGIDHAANEGYLLILLGAAVSTLLALMLGYRYLRVPTSVLLDAARRWGGGDLSARAVMPAGSAPEFRGLSKAFNDMAEVLLRQRAELQALNDALELRVADRTRALLASNNRLQVAIAERELTEASLSQAHKLQAVGQLAGGMAHEFNNMLTVILGSLELLRKRLPDLGARQSKLIDTALHAVERGARLTAQLLAFSRKQPLLGVSVDVSDLLRGMAGLLASTLGPNVRLETRIEDALWPATLDPNQFEASILNLALNSRDAMPSGGRLIIAATNLTMTPASAWSELPPGDYVCITVSDTGVGMPAETVNRVFEPFFTTKAPGKGTGLGLSQVHGMVRQAGGSITIDSLPNEGTRIQMLFPRAASEAVRRGELSDPSQPALDRGEVVLLVDDDDDVREVTEIMLAESGYTVLAAHDGDHALAILESQGHRIRLVIADYAMPGMTGRELLDIVKQRWPGAAILLATGYADYPELSGGELPMDQIVPKPFRSNELLARIHMVIRRQHDREPVEDGVATS